MSDDTTTEQPTADYRLEQKRAALAKARKVKLERLAEARSAPQRTAADVRSAATTPAARAEPAREPTTGPEQLTRRKRIDRAVGGFDIPKHRQKPGWDYQWITIRVLNESVDPARIRDFREGGWRPTMAGDFPELCEEGAPTDSPIETEGMRLYERPMNFTMEAKQEDLKYAQDQQRDRMMAAASGKSAVRGEDGIPSRGGVRPVPVSVEIEGLAG